MSLYVDEQSVAMDESKLGAMLAGVQRRLADQGRVVVEVQVDGQPLTSEEIDQRSNEAVADSVVRLLSAKPDDLALEVLDQIRTRLGEARTLQDQAADLFQRDQPGEALGKVSEAIEAWLQTQQAVMQVAGLLQIDIETLMIDGEPMSHYTQELVTRLNELKTLIQQHETVGMADALAYEWPQLTDRWDRLVEALIETIESAE